MSGLSVAARNLLLVKPGSMGDVVHALPVASAIGRAWPGCRISWLVDVRWAPLLKDNPHVARVVEFPREGFRGPWGLVRGALWARRLQELRPEVCIDLQGLLRSALMAKGSRAEMVLGLRDAREGARFFYDAVTPVPRGEHSVTRYLRILNPLGIEPPAVPEFPLPPGSRPTEAPDPPYLLIHPASRGRGKSLPPETLAAILHALRGRQAVIVGAGTPLPTSGALNLTGRTSLEELIWLIRNAQGVLSVDSGPAHLAAALQRPLLSIHTWADPRLVGPFSNSAWVWQNGTISPARACGFEPSPPPLPADADAIVHALLALTGHGTPISSTQP